MAHEELLLLIKSAFPGTNLPLLAQISDVISIAPAGIVTHCDFIQLTSRETSTQSCCRQPLKLGRHNVIKCGLKTRMAMCCHHFLSFAVLWLIEIALSSVCAVWLCENYVVVVPEADKDTSPSCEGLSTAHKNVILGEMMKLRAGNSCAEWVYYREGLKRGNIVESVGQARMLFQPISIAPLHPLNVFPSKVLQNK